VPGGHGLAGGSGVAKGGGRAAAALLAGMLAGLAAERVAAASAGVSIRVSLPRDCAAGLRPDGGLAVVCLGPGEVLVRARHAGAAGALSLELAGRRTRLAPGEAAVVLRREGPVFGVTPGRIEATGGATRGDLRLEALRR